MSKNRSVGIVELKELSERLCLVRLVAVLKKLGIVDESWLPTMSSNDFDEVQVRNFSGHAGSSKIIGGQIEQSNGSPSANDGWYLTSKQIIF